MSPFQVRVAAEFAQQQYSAVCRRYTELLRTTPKELLDLCPALEHLAQEQTACVIAGAALLDACGDALDSNGGVSLTGGSIGVWARTTTGEGAIDFNGTGTISGANLIVASTGGVMQDTATLTGQSVMVLSVSAASGDEIRLQREDGETLMSFTLENSCDTILVSSAQLAEGSAFSLLSGEKVLYAGSMSGNLYSAGAYGQNGFGGMGGGRGGMGGPNEMPRGGGRGRGR